MSKFKVWVHISVERFDDLDGDPVNSFDDAMPDSIGTFDTLKQAEAAARKLVEDHVEDPENSDWTHGALSPDLFYNTDEGE